MSIITGVDEVSGKGFDYIIIGTIIGSSHAWTKPHIDPLLPRRWSTTADILGPRNILTNVLQNTGLTLAVKLSEDASKSVLVLESGEANLNDQVLRESSPSAAHNVDMPNAAAVWTVLHGSHYGQPQYDWDHKTVSNDPSPPFTSH